MQSVKAGGEEQEASALEEALQSRKKERLNLVKQGIESFIMQPTPTEREWQEIEW